MDAPTGMHNGQIRDQKHQQRSHVVQKSNGLNASMNQAKSKYIITHSKSMLNKLADFHLTFYSPGFQDIKIIVRCFHTFALNNIRSFLKLTHLCLLEEFIPERMEEHDAEGSN